MLEPMRPLVTALQGMFVEVYFGFHIFAVDKEIERTTQQNQLHSTGNER